VYYHIPGNIGKKSFGKSVTTFGSYGLVKQSLGAGYSGIIRISFQDTHLQSDEGFRANSAH
jgi:iron complex outermembrane receptor protein